MQDSFYVHLFRWHNTAHENKCASQPIVIVISYRVPKMAYIAWRFQLCRHECLSGTKHTTLRLFIWNYWSKPKWVIFFIFISKDAHDIHLQLYQWSACLYSKKNITQSLCLMMRISFTFSDWPPSKQYFTSQK